MVNQLFRLELFYQQDSTCALRYSTTIRIVSLPYPLIYCFVVTLPTTPTTLHGNKFIAVWCVELRRCKPSSRDRDQQIWPSLFHSRSVLFPFKTLQARVFVRPFSKNSRRTSDHYGNHCHHKMQQLNEKRNCFFSFFKADANRKR